MQYGINVCFDNGLLPLQNQAITFKSVLIYCQLHPKEQILWELNKKGKFSLKKTRHNGVGSPLYLSTNSLLPGDTIWLQTYWSTMAHDDCIQIYVSFLSACHHDDPVQLYITLPFQPVTMTILYICISLFPFSMSPWQSHTAVYLSSHPVCHHDDPV